jgi:hypothetical protein
MSDAVLVAIISGSFTTLGGIILAILGWLLSRRVNRIAEDTKATRVQVENDHPTNLREENDERHHENSTKLDTLIETVEAMKSSLVRLWGLTTGFGKRTKRPPNRWTK